MSAKYCPECGSHMEERHRVGLHQQCDCGRFIGYNPISVNVVLQPVRMLDGSLGLLAGVRGIQPGLGQVSLPGGYHDVGETAREAAVRELFEEFGVRVAPEVLAFFDLQGNKVNSQVIICWIAPELREADLPPFEANPEVTERLIVTHGQGMAFSSHARWTHEYLSGTPWAVPALVGL